MIPGNITILNFAANEPKTDSLLLGKRKFYENGDKGQKASFIIGATLVHKLQDALEAYLHVGGMGWG